MPKVDRSQRFVKGNACPICGGVEEMTRGPNGNRCHGFLSEDRRVAHCSREEYAGGLDRDGAQTFAHLLAGECKCGKRHDQGPVVVPFKRRADCFYDYTDADGNIVFQVRRYGYGKDKTFTQHAPDGKGGWINSIEGVPRPLPLYRLQEVISALERHVPIFFPEGEDDVESIRAKGGVATTSAMGADNFASSFGPETAALFKDAIVIVVHDNDVKGRRLRDEKATALRELVASLKCPDLPGLKGKDVSDWFDEGHTLDELYTLAVKTEEWTPSTVVWEGDDVEFRYPQAQAAVRFDSLRENSHGIDGNITARSDAHGLLHWGHIDLASITARKSLCDKLEKLYPIGWHRKIEQACHETATTFRTSDPVEPLTPRRRVASEGYWVQGLVPKTTTLIYGPGANAKSLLGLAVGLSVASGTSIIGDLNVVEPAPVLYLDFEDEKDEHEYRLADLLEGAKIPNPPNLYYRRMRGPLVRSVAALRLQVAVRRIGLVIVDSLSWAATSGLRYDEQAQEVFGALRSLAPATALVLGHVTNAATTSSGPANVFGSVQNMNAGRLGWQIVAADRLDPNDPLVVTLHPRKQNRAPLLPVSLKINFSPDSITIDPAPLDNTPELGKRATAREKILFAARSGAKTYKRYAAITGLNPETVERTVRRLVNNKRMVYVQDDPNPQDPIDQDPIDKGMRWGLMSRTG